MRKLKTGVLAGLLAAGVCLLSGCGQVDETFLENNADFSVSINVPYPTSSPLPEYLNVPDQVVIDSEGAVTVNDSALLSSSKLSSKADESKYSTLSVGDTNDSVRALQSRLSALGYYAGGVSGVFDEATEAAVKRFEQTYGIMQTGIATPAFQVRLYAADAPAYGSEAYDTAVVSQYSTLQRGAVGSAVYALQHRLKELGYPIKDLTGVYDDATENAVRLFGRSYGLDDQTVAYIALQKELYSDSALPYSSDVQNNHQISTAILGKGNVGTKVMQIQNRLIKLGYLKGSASGVYDQATENAVRVFETACGVESTGRLNGELMALLMSGEAPIYGAAYTVEARTFSDLGEGSQGEQVVALQQRLIELGYAAGSANGVYGSETSAAVRMFQQYNGLSPNGYATAEVQQSMFSLGALSYQDIVNGLTFVTPSPEPTAGPTLNPGSMGGMAGLRTLVFNSSGDDVKRIQERLNKLGYECSVDGVYDESTIAAMQAFQANVGVSQTGEASLSMQQYIYTNAAPAKKYCMHNATQDFTTLQQGDTGDDVTRLQEKLWELGYLLTDDVKESIGIFHDKTYEAVASAQEAMGYTEPDGVATPEFQCFVFSEYNYFIKR
ncbi:MAG: peptidoglycan-binding protein [Clostridia bacterium]|nr:peptidoglycan-binding protein [Clostridia bacterium]